MKKNYTISIPVGTFWKVLVPSTLLLLIVGGIIGVFIVDKFIVPNLTGVNNRGVVKVPLIINQSKDDAKQALYDIGLRLQAQAHEYNDSLERNSIIRQNPAAYEEVKKGRHVFVTLSKGCEIGTIPDVRQVSERIGRNLLRDSGFTNVKVFKAYSDRTEKNKIMYSDPKRDMTISREIPVKLTVSKGAKPTHVVVPNVIGEILSVAKESIRKSGLRVGKVEYKVGTSARAGAVISQSHSPGSNASLESSINLVVAGKM